ncbi:PASTA domain-containing protein [bacterium]|nr:PASTA domain-containing protein [bacterium]
MASSRRACGVAAAEREGVARETRGMKVWEFLLLLAGLGVIAVALVVAINFTVLPRIVHRNTVVLTPDVRGMTVDGARLAVDEHGLTVAEDRDRAHPTIPRGMILEQTPAAGSPIRSGRRVQVITSSGPPTGGVPDLTGLSYRQAEITLQRENFRLGRVSRIVRDDVTSLTVVFQNPPAARELRKGRPVDLVVAEPAPPRLLCVPDLRGLAVYLARQMVTDAGCVLAPIVYERTDRTAPNLVLRQTPAPGHRIREGERIELVASSP